MSTWKIQDESQKKKKKSIKSIKDDNKGYELKTIYMQKQIFKSQ